MEISSLFANVIIGEGTGDPPEYPVEAANADIGVSQLDIHVVPEPATAWLLILGGLLLFKRDG